MRKLSAVVLGVAALCVFAVAAYTVGGRGTGEAAAKMKEEAGAGAAPAAAPRRPVIVELFTSEGCSSCPPADALLSKLDATQPVAGAEVIPLAMHVDYWNHLGWADPFSAREFSERQGEYAAAFGNSDVYTPQMIVDGVREFNGGNPSLAHEAVSRASREPKAEVRLTRGSVQADGTVGVSVSIDRLPQQTEGDPVHVLLAVTESGLSTDVGRGENSGRKLSHVGVVRTLRQLGVLPEARGVSFKAETGVLVGEGWRRENLRAVVFAQERGTRRVLAAASLKLFE